jgi:lipoprotein NlpI
VAERLSPEQFVGPLTSEERRQVVKEAKSRGFSQTVLIGAQVCAECHQDVVAQWAVSAHRFSSFNNPFYEASIEDLRRAPRGQIRARWCASCHDPALLLTGDFNPGFDRNGAQAQAGLTCLACHGIRDIAGRPGNGNYVMGPGLLGANDPLLSPDRKLHIGDPEAVKLHKQNVLTRRHQSAEFCGACHKASIPEEVNNYHWFRAQNDYDAWHDSGISGNAARSFITQDVTKDCRACHMPLEDAPLGDLAAKNGKVRSHRFLAVNTALPALRGDMESVNRIKEFLSGRVSIDLSTVQRGVNFDEYIPLPDVTRPVLIAGEEVQLDVVVRNRDVGHTFPGGTLDLNEGWVELSLLGPDGELLAVSGDRGKDERLDPEAHAYSALFLNDSGKPITRHNVADIRTPVWRHVIPYGEADLIRYRFKIPRQLAGKLITFRGRLLLRKFNEPFLRFSETNVKGFRGRKLTLPIIELASSETSLAVSDRPSDARAPDLLKIHPEHWGRLNDYGIAALLQRDFDAAEYAFLQVQKLAPGTTEGLLNYARTMIEEGNTVEGLKALDRLTSLIPEDPRLSWSFGQAYFMRREYELAAKAFRNVVRLRPSDRQSWGMLGHSLMIQGDSEKALTALDKVLEIDPVNEWANFFKASALRDLKRDSEASRYSAAYEKYKEDYYARNRQWRHREKSPIDHREAYPFHWHVLRYIDN